MSFEVVGIFHDGRRPAYDRIRDPSCSFEATLPSPASIECSLGVAKLHSRLRAGALDDGEGFMRFGCILPCHMSPGSLTSWPGLLCPGHSVRDRG